MVAHGRRADVLALVVHARAVLRIAHRDAGLHVDMRPDIDGVVQEVGGHEVAVHAVQRVDDAVTIRMGDKLQILAILALLIGKHHHVDASIVPLVVRGLLIAPLEHAVVGIAGHDGHGPLVVAGTHGLVPRRGVARSVVNQVESRIVGIPTPVGAAADLPGIAFPRGKAETLLTVLRVVLVEVVADADFSIGTGRVSAPHHLGRLRRCRPWCNRGRQARHPRNRRSRCL